MVKQKSGKTLIDNLLHEAKPLWAFGVVITWDMNIPNRTKFLKSLAQILHRRIIMKIFDVQAIGSLPWHCKNCTQIQIEVQGQSGQVEMFHAQRRDQNLQANFGSHAGRPVCLSVCTVCESERLRDSPVCLSVRARTDCRGDRHTVDSEKKNMPGISFS